MQEPIIEKIYGLLKNGSEKVERYDFDRPFFLNSAHKTIQTKSFKFLKDFR